MKPRIKQIAWAVLALGLAAGAFGRVHIGKSETTAVTVPAEWLKTEIFFGCDLPGGQQISRGAWADFMDKVLTFHFPKGLTVYEAYGQMQHADGRIEKQSTWVVVILHPKDPVTDQAIQEIIDAFRKQFNNAQTVRISTPVTTAQFYAD